MLLFPRGIGFQTDKRQLTFHPWKGRVVPGLRDYGFAIRVPDQALKNAVEFGHFGDLGITMFTIIVLNRNDNPKVIYLFFLLLTLHDYRHTASVGNFLKWARHYRWRIPESAGIHRRAAP